MKERRRELEGSLPYFIRMTAQEQIEAFIDQCLEGSDCFLVSFKVKPTNNYKVYLDSDTGFTLEQSVRINRRLRHLIDEAGLYPEGNYSLEVSSPGVDEPLKWPRQYRKHIGRKLELRFVDAERPVFTGRLKELDDIRITLIPLASHLRSRSREIVSEPVDIPWEEIQSATVQIEF